MYYIGDASLEDSRFESTVAPRLTERGNAMGKDVDTAGMRQRSWLDLAVWTGVGVALGTAIFCLVHHYIPGFRTIWASGGMCWCSPLYQILDSLFGPVAFGFGVLYALIAAVMLARPKFSEVARSAAVTMMLCGMPLASMNVMQFGWARMNPPNYGVLAAGN